MIIRFVLPLTAFLLSASLVALNCIKASQSYQKPVWAIQVGCALDRKLRVSFSTNWNRRASTASPARFFLGAASGWTTPVTPGWLRAHNQSQVSVTPKADCSGLRFGSRSAARAVHSLAPLSWTLSFWTINFHWQSFGQLQQCEGVSLSLGTFFNRAFWSGRKLKSCSISYPARKLAMYFSSRFALLEAPRFLEFPLVSNTAPFFKTLDFYCHELS